MKIVSILKFSFIIFNLISLYTSSRSLKSVTNISAAPAAAAPPAAPAKPAAPPAAPAKSAAPPAAKPDAKPAAKPAADKKPADTKAGARSSGGASITNTNVLPNQPKSTNAVGQLGMSNYTVSEPPYTIKSCDQLVQFEAQILTDFDDFSKKKPAFFTISIYMLNMFESSTSSKLSLSILLDNIRQEPFLLTGSVSCISINDAKNRKTIGLCLPNKDRMNDILKVFRDFFRCRAGDDLKPIPIDVIKHLIRYKNCSEKIVNETLTNSTHNFDQYVIKKNVDYGKWMPEFLTPVPGSM